MDENNKKEKNFLSQHRFRISFPISLHVKIPFLFESDCTTLDCVLGKNPFCEDKFIYSQKYRPAPGAQYRFI